MSLASLEILPVQDKTPPDACKVDPVLPALPFSILAVGPCASGKTSTCLNLWLRKSFYRDCFDSVYVFSPTAAQDKTWRPALEDPRVTIFPGYDDAVLRQIFDNQNEDSDADRAHVLVILDDCSGMLRPGSFLNELATKHRHPKISLYISSQLAKGFGPAVRENASAWLLFRTHTSGELMKSLTELAGGFRDLEGLYREATKKKFAFLYLDTRRRKAYQNFTRLLWEEPPDGDESEGPEGAAAGAAAAAKPDVKRPRGRAAKRRVRGSRS